MASTLTGLRCHNIPHFVGKSYEIAINQSIEASYPPYNIPIPNIPPILRPSFNNSCKFKVDPPLESIWVYAALTFTRPSTAKTESFSRISDIKDLFQLIVSCSASCNSIKGIALVAPVIYNFHNFILDVYGFQLGSKKKEKLMEKSEVWPLEDLSSFWLVDNNGVEKNNPESLRTFFPLLSDDIVKKVSDEGCGMIDLAGFVIAEAFLLKLCRKIREEGFGEKMQNELRSWIVGSITGLRSSYFYVTLLSMLLDPVLPITSVMNHEHEDGLRKVLFDALILVEYFFLSPESLGKLPVEHAKRVILTKLLATHEAIELFREHGDQTKAIPYTNAFANSSLPNLIIKWIKSEIGNKFNPNKPTRSSPRAFLRWLINIENRGIKIFDDDMSKFRTAFNSEEALEQIADMEEGKQHDSDLLFYIDHKGQEEYVSEEDEKMKESMSAAFTAAAHSMQSNKGGRKRKTKDGEKKNQVKFVKYKAFDHSSLSGERCADPRSDHSDSGSDLENPSSDKDMK
ncbi:hypothetical protein DH2020_014548 [Rehmannia glutinosa]|uniref:Uncharacterized protein n=1 Tax=Rehmannia glutinosa TaxID=99300 RepID=A0ABR0WWQ4_REHGL